MVEQYVNFHDSIFSRSFKVMCVNNNSESKVLLVSVQHLHSKDLKTSRGHHTFVIACLVSKCRHIYLLSHGLQWISPQAGISECNKTSKNLIFTF